MKIKLLHSFLLAGLLSTPQWLHAQKAEKEPKYNFSNGLGLVTPDSTFSINFRFRTQLRSTYNTMSTSDFSANDIEARVRRLRLRMDGFLINQKFTYNIQLSFSRGDMDWSGPDNSNVNSSPNIVRDAALIYKPNKKLSIIFGQRKLPGNRQRVISSGELQFADRSIVNATFNIDRDFGVQCYYQDQLAGIPYALKGAITTGEGRNSNLSNAGLAYTGRVEVFPLGTFTNGGDYFEGDLEREKKPKLSIAAGYHFNESAARTAGTLGKDLYQNRNLKAFIADMVFKYKGFALTAEYITRNTDNPITINAANAQRIVYVGNGKMMQMSYNFKNDIELAGRYALITPYSSIQTKELQKEEIGLGVTKYLRKHRVKLQGNLFYYNNVNMSTSTSTHDFWSGTFQVELGI